MGIAYSETLQKQQQNRGRINKESEGKIEFKLMDGWNDVTSSGFFLL
jgi:hypothetical protein